MTYRTIHDFEGLNACEEENTLLVRVRARTWEGTILERQLQAEGEEGSG